MIKSFQILALTALATLAFVSAVLVIYAQDKMAQWMPQRSNKR
jgi:hypothetical protein